MPGGYDQQEGLAELNLTGVMVTFRTRSRLDMPRPLVTNPSLPAGRVALRCGGNVLVELESYGRGPKWTPRTGLQTGSVASEAVRRWDDFPLVDSHCLSGPFGSWISCPDIPHPSRPISWTSRGASSGLGPVSPVDEVAARRPGRLNRQPSRTGLLGPGPGADGPVRSHPGLRPDAGRRHTPVLGACPLHPPGGRPSRGRHHLARRPDQVLRRPGRLGEGDPAGQRDHHHAP